MLSKKKIVYLILIPTVILPLFLKDPYLMHIIIIALWLSVMASSWNVVGGYAGQPNLGHAALVGIGGYISALSWSLFGVPNYLGMLLGGIGATAAALGIGALSLRLRGAYFIIVSIGLSEIVRLIAENEYNITGGSPGTITSPFMGIYSKVFYYYFILGILLTVIFIVHKMTESPVGLALLAIRDDVEVAEVIGVNTTLQKLTAFLISGFFAGVSGAFYAHYILLISPEVVSLSYMFIILCSTILGGVGTILGPIIGSFLFEFFSEFMRGYMGEYHLLLFGLILLLTARFAPGGIIGTIKQLSRRGRA